MDTTSLKSYAPKARQDFIAAVTRRAVLFGSTASGTSQIREEGQLVFIEGQPYPKAVGIQRQKLAVRVQQQGFEQVMEAAAYTWFNRFAAIRFMELHGYLDHSFRVLSPSPHGGEGRGEGGLPEILDHAQNVDLPGLDRERVIELKMDGTRDEELYRDLLLAQCRALNRAMPFLFERVDDETELLLPDNLLQTDSLIRELVNAIPEEDWQEIEIIGWLYQFYISEKKDQVIGKVVKSEDIPAATQLFTPNWIVKYMVQNSLGAQWLATYPDSPLKGQMEFYIEPAVQMPKVQAQLEKLQREWLVEKGLGVRGEGIGINEGAIVATEDTSALNPNPYTLSPEHLTLIDPACGSGHILVEAYELFQAIYLERGYRQRDVPQLILEKNLFGLDIDERAAQLTGFALMMKGRADYRRLFERGVKLNVMALVDSAGFDEERLIHGMNLSDYGLRAGDLTELRRLFEHATTFGSLIQVPEGLAAKLPALKQLSEVKNQDLFVSDALKRLGPQVQQAELLAAQYDAVVANPPYMGSKFQAPVLKRFAKDHFPDSKSDLFSCFIELGYTLVKECGLTAMVAMQSWMFLSSFDKMRKRLLRDKTITTLAHLGARAFGSISGEVVQTAAFVLKNQPPHGFKPMFFRLLDGDEKEKQAALSDAAHAFAQIAQDEFQKIPGCPVAYWAGKTTFTAFSDRERIETLAETRKGMVTASNATYVRHWFEVDQRELGFGMIDRTSAKDSGRKWFPYLKGGGFRRWSGNQSEVVDWADDGRRLRSTMHPTEDRVWATNFNLEQIFQPNVNWSDITSGLFAARISTGGSLFDATSLSCFPEDASRLQVLGFLNSKIADGFLQFLNPTLHYQAGNIADLPCPAISVDAVVDQRIEKLVHKATEDWNAYETSWGFLSLPLLGVRGQGAGASGDKSSSLIPNPSSLSQSYTTWTTQNRNAIAEMKRLEEENNRLFIDAYGLADELTPDVPIEQITLTVNPAYRYGVKGVRDEGLGARDEGLGARDEEVGLIPNPYTLYPKLEARFRQDTMAELVSYAIGCMMGRYRLDRPGLIYAHSGNERFWEIYEGGNRDEGRGVSKELSGSDRVAEVDGVGGTGLSDDQGISSRGAIWPVQSDSAGGGVDSIEHSRGSCAPEQGGVSELSLHRSGIEGRSGDTDLNSGASGVCNGATGRDDPLSAIGAIQDAQHPETQTSPSPLAPNPFHPDEDGIVPLTDTDWFDDDATHRLIEFIGVAFGAEDSEKKINPSTLTPNPSPRHLEANLTFLAENLSPRKSESSRETIRRYLYDSFFKDHLQIYKKRPIYWLFSSGKQKGFQCLVYLHRYNEGTLARMRMEYVVPLQSKMAARIDKLADDIQAATTSAQAKRLQKERDKLTRQLDELRRFDEQLRHYADLRIKLDLDDGVKVNYGKFGDLLAEVKAVTGKAPQ